MARETAAEKKARLAAEEEAASTGIGELDSLLDAGYEAGEADVEDLDTEYDTSELMNAEAAVDFEAFADTVIAQCEKIELLKGKTSGAKYVKLTWRVLEGSHAKQCIFDTVMLEGKGVGMGKKKLTQLGVDIAHFKGSDLKNAVYNLTTKIKHEPEDSDYEDKTEVKKYGARVSNGGEVTEVAEDVLP